MAQALVPPNTDLERVLRGSDVLRDYDLESTTLWDFEYQSPAVGSFGDPRFNGVTPAGIVTNLVRRYTRPGDLVVDAMAGSGTTVDVARALGRRVLAFDIAPQRAEIARSDARHLPLLNDSVDLHFVDPPYSDNIRYSEDPACLGKIPAGTVRWLEAMEHVARELHRTLKPGHVLGWLISDEYRHGRFTPVGFHVFELLHRFFEPVDIVCIVRHHDRSLNPMWEHRARKFGFYLRGFKYLFITRKREREPSEEDIG
jgi:DNA modification methylase